MEGGVHPEHEGVELVNGNWFCAQGVDYMVLEAMRRSGHKEKLVRLSLGLAKRRNADKLLDRLQGLAEKKSGLSRQEMDRLAREAAKR